MSESEDFYKNKHSDGAYEISIFEEIRNLMNRQRTPIKSALSAINKFHGEFGVSKDLAKKVNKVSKRNGTKPSIEDMFQEEEFLFLKRVMILEKFFSSTKNITKTSELIKIRDFVFPELENAVTTFLTIIADIVTGVYQSNDIVLVDDSDVIITKDEYLTNPSIDTSVKLDTYGRIYFADRQNTTDIAQLATQLNEMVVDALYAADELIREKMRLELARLDRTIKKKDKGIAAMAKSTELGKERYEKKLADVKEASNFKNKTFGSDMDILTLRQFVGFSQNIHPAITRYINKNIGQYPYFQKISEFVGSTYYNFTMPASLFDPLSSVLSDGQWNNNTCSLLRNDTYRRSFLGAGQMTEYATGFLDTLFHMNSPLTNNMGLMNPSYVDDGASAHGLSHCNDVFHKDRLLNVKDAAYSTLVGQFGDRLRLLNQFFPTRYVFSNRNTLYDVQGTTVDRTGRTYTPRTMNIKKSMGYSEEANNNQA